MNFGMIRFMRKFYRFRPRTGFSFHSFARESTLLDSGWRFILGEPADWRKAMTRSELD